MYNVLVDHQIRLASLAGVLLLAPSAEHYAELRFSPIRFDETIHEFETWLSQ